MYSAWSYRPDICLWCYFIMFTVLFKYAAFCYPCVVYHIWSITVQFCQQFVIPAGTLTRCLESLETMDKENPDESKTTDALKQVNHPYSTPTFRTCAVKQSLCYCVICMIFDKHIDHFYGPLAWFMLYFTYFCVQFCNKAQKMFLLLIVYVVWLVCPQLPVSCANYFQNCFFIPWCPSVCFLSGFSQSHSSANFLLSLMFSIYIYPWLVQEAL